ncbi:MAG: hypothetical protein RSG52_11110 [Terrisporobacter sp.]|uniref:hypothetical protein n=1 Tax=Terrisporobacter sp. TaxID=1965305 RepID=UPI002FC9D7F6
MYNKYIVTFINVTRLSSNYVLEQILAWSFGLIGIISLIIKIKKPEKASLCYIPLTASVSLGIIYLFFFMKFI